LLVMGLISMIATALAIHIGSLLYRRFQHAAVKREFAKLKWTPLVAVCLSVSLLTSQMALGQTEQTKEQLRTANIQELLDRSVALMQHIKSSCKTAECAATAEQGLKILAEAKAKHAKGQLTGSEWKSFKAVWHDYLLFSLEVLQRNVPISDEDVAAITGKPSIGHGQLVPVIVNDPCGMCSKVFAAASAICGMWALANPAYAAFCEAYAIQGFMECIDQWC
jgi:hypothetical protein